MKHKNLLLLAFLLHFSVIVAGAQEAPTHIKVFLKNQESKVIPVAEIDSIRFEKSEMPTDQMPLINFNYATDKATIDAYEATLGRQLQEGINLNNDASETPNPLPAYVNLSLDLVPIVSYGLSIDLLESDAIVALCREPIDESPRIQALISALGFQETYYDETSRQYKKDDISIIMQHWPNSEWGTKSCLTIMCPKPPTPVDKEHDFVPTAKDFPSIDALLSGDKEQIIAFEQESGYRDIPTDMDYTYLSFNTKADRANDSNIKIAFYWLDDPHITGIFSAISSVDEVLTDSQIHEWATLNGFEGPWSRVVEHNDVMDVDVVYAVCSNDKATLRVFYELQRMKFEIIPNQ